MSELGGVDFGEGKVTRYKKRSPEVEATTDGYYWCRSEDVSALEARLSKMEEVLGDGGDLEYAANLLQTATNDCGLDQSFDNNPYWTSDYLRRLSALASQEEA